MLLEWFISVVFYIWIFKLPVCKENVFCSNFACCFIDKLGTTELAFKTLGFFYR